MNNPLPWIAFAIVVAGGAAFYHWRTTAPPEAPPAPPPSVAQAAPEAVVQEDAIAHPVPEPQPGAAPLPPLADSDTLAGETASGLVGRDAFTRYFYPDGMIRRFVATVDNLPRKTASVRLLPVRPVPGAFVVSGTPDNREIGADNALRYRPYVLAMEAVEAKRLVAAYVRLYPLFQTAYQELGYPKGYFNDRLVYAIDDLLAAPDIASPRLVQPKVVYEYADPDLETRSAGQKIMVRMGIANAARVKDKLRAIRRELTSRPALP